MHVPLTFALLVLLTGIIVALRFVWWRMPPWLQSFLVAGAVAMFLIRFVFVVSHWSMTSTRLNALLCWTSAVGYEVLLVRFSLMRPRWLTSLSAVILLVPIFGSTLLLPLTRIFDWAPADISAIGGPYICEKSGWDTTVVGNSGMDLIVFYRPRFAPFLRHLVQRAAFADDQCESVASSAVADVTNKVVHFHCPGRSGKQTDIELTLPLP